MEVVDVVVCRGCPLKGKSGNVVYGRLLSGEEKVNLSKVKVVLIGEAPGAEEERLGVPFVGKSGKLLREVVKELCEKYGVKEDEVYITNVVKCRPPNNRTPMKEEIQKCSYFLERELSKLNKSKVIIVCLGRVAKEWFRIGGSIVDARNKIRDTKWGKVIVTWHPAARNLYFRDALGVRDVDRFRGDLDNVFRWVSEEKTYRTADYVVVESWEDIERMVKEVVGERFALDFETVGKDIFSKKFSVVCYGVGTSLGSNYIVDVRKVGEEKAKKILQVLWEVGKPVMFNVPFDMSVAVKWGGVSLRNDVDDLQFLYYLVNGGRLKGFSLKTLAMEFTEFGDYGLKDEELENVLDVPAERLWAYCATDVKVTYDLFGLFYKRFENGDFLEWSGLFGNSMKSLIYAYKELCGVMGFVVSGLRLNGMKVDVKYLEELKKRIEVDISEIQKKVIELEGSVNLNSPQQVMKVLRRRGINVESTSKEVLSVWEGDEFVKLLLDYRELLKLYKTYVIGLIEEVFKSVDGFVHADFSAVGTATGRIASSDPNLMNIPTRMGPIIEKAFVSRFGDEGVIVKADLSQHELRVAALYSKDENMIEAYRQDRDLHTEVAIKVYGLKEEEIGTEREKELRRYAKGFNFGVIYGRGAKSIAQELGIGEEEAVKLKNEYFRYFRGLRRWLEEVVDFGKKKGYVRSMFGRVRYLSVGEEDNEDEKMNMVSVAVNTPIQSAASDIAVKICAMVMERLSSLGLQSKVVNFIHDAILVDCYLPELEVVQKVIREAVAEVEIPVEKLVPFKIDIAYGKSWGDCKEK